LPTYLTRDYVYFICVLRHTRFSVTARSIYAGSSLTLRLLPAVRTCRSYLRFVVIYSSVAMQRPVPLPGSIDCIYRTFTWIATHLDYVLAHRIQFCRSPLPIRYTFTRCCTRCIHFCDVLLPPLLYRCCTHVTLLHTPAQPAFRTLLVAVVFVTPGSYRRVAHCCAVGLLRSVRVDFLRPTPAARLLPLRGLRYLA